MLPEMYRSAADGYSTGCRTGCWLLGCGLSVIVGLLGILMLCGVVSLFMGRSGA